MTLEAIAEMIENDVMGGLKGVTNYTLSTEQIMEEITLVGNRMIHERNQQGFLTPEDVFQSIPCIELECKDISECCNVKSGKTALISKEPIPKFLVLAGVKPVQYIGTIDQSNQFKYLENFTEFIHSKFSPSGHLPTAFVNTSNHLVIANPPTSSLKWVQVTALFSEPSELKKYSCVCGPNGETEYQRPSWLIDQIKSKIVNDYLRYYRMGAITQPNTQEQINMTSK